MPRLTDIHSRVARALSGLRLDQAMELRDRVTDEVEDQLWGHILELEDAIADALRENRELTATNAELEQRLLDLKEQLKAERALTRLLEAEAAELRVRLVASADADEPQDGPGPGGDDCTTAMPNANSCQDADALDLTGADTCVHVGKIALAAPLEDLPADEPSTAGAESVAEAKSPVPTGNEESGNEERQPASALGSSAGAKLEGPSGGVSKPDNGEVRRISRQRRGHRRDLVRQRDAERTELLRNVAGENSLLIDCAAMLLADIESAAAELAKAQEHRQAAEATTVELRRHAPTKDERPLQHKASRRH